MKKIQPDSGLTLGHSSVIALFVKNYLSGQFVWFSLLRPEDHYLDRKIEKGKFDHSKIK